MLQWSYSGGRLTRLSVSIEGRNRKRWTGRGLLRGALIWTGSEESAFHSKSDTRSLEIFSVVTPLGLFLNSPGCYVSDRL